MIDQNRTDELDEVLFAFHQACADPSAAEIIAWTERYPQYAEDIRTHAAILKDWAAREDQPADEPDEAMLARARSRALDALFNAEAEQRTAETGKALSFEQMMIARGTNVPALARELDVPRSVLADVFGGGMYPPMGSRLLDGLSEKLRFAKSLIEAAVDVAVRTPILGHAKANAPPGIVQRSYAEIIKDTSMSPERKSYWLEED